MYTEVIRIDIVTISGVDRPFVMLCFFVLLVVMWSLALDNHSNTEEETLVCPPYCAEELEKQRLANDRGKVSGGS